MHTRHGARFGELEQLAALHTDRRDDLGQGLGNHRVHLLGENARQAPRQRDRELRELFEIGLRQVP